MLRLLNMCAFLVALTVLGTLGLWLIEDDYGFLDALYMTVITLTTVGYDEVQPLTTSGRIFVMVYLVCGIGIFFFSVVTLGEMVVRNEMRHWLERRRMDTAIRSLEHHFIVCGFGRMGEIVCGRLAERGLPLVVIEADEERLTECRKAGFHWIQGDAAGDETLSDAGIERARGLAAVLGTDADNLYVVFSARLMNPKLQILARATGSKQAAKIERAGADRVVSPLAAGANQIAQLLANPRVENFMEIFKGQGSELDLAEMQIAEGSEFAGVELRDTEFARHGIVIVGIRKREGPFLIPPPSDTRIDVGDSLIALGRAESVQDFCSRA